MNEPVDNARAAYYRAIFRLQFDAQGRKIPNPPVPPEVYAAGQRHFDRVMARLGADTARVRPFRVESRAAQLGYLHSEFGEIRPKGIGIGQGEYATISSAQVNDSTRFIATDGLIDCQGLILVARDANGQVTQTLLAHIDAKTDLKQALPELMRHMPEESRIEASIISSPNSYNHYLQADLMEALYKYPNVTRIRHGFDAAHTIAVDTKTGHILTATGAIEPVTLQAAIDQWPIDIQFKAFTNEVGLELNRVSERFFRQKRQTPAFGLHRAYDAEKGFIINDVLSSFVIERQHNDGLLNASELHEIASYIGTSLNTQVKLAYSLDDAGVTTINIQTLDGKTLEQFVSPKIAADLGRSGVIDPPNTPPAPGRAPATDTMSPPSGRAPTGRR